MIAFPKAHIINSSTCGGTVLGGANGGSIDSGGRAPNITNCITIMHFTRGYIMTILQTIKAKKKLEPIMLDFVKYASRLFRILEWIVISQLCQSCLQISGKFTDLSTVYVLQILKLT